jgi:hypothetical protein
MDRRTVHFDAIAWPQIAFIVELNVGVKIFFAVLDLDRAQRVACPGCER